MNMTENYFRRLSEEIIRQWMDYNHEELRAYDISMVWSGYILGNRKGLYAVLVGKRPFDGLYFEVTASDGQFTLDIYRKCDQVIQMRETDEL